MTENRGFLAELIHRRVPQVLGLYIAGTWMAIEIGEWASERLALSGILTLYLFVVMAVMIPSVLIFTWFHGAPGKDRWTPVETITIPVNILLAILAVWIIASRPAQQQIQLDPQLEESGSVPTAETRVLIDETGAEQEFVVAPRGVSRRMLAFFWPSDGDEDWVSYAVPWLLSLDLGRDMRLSANTPYSSPGVRDVLVSSGFGAAVHEPVALDLQIARDQRTQLMVVGRHRSDAEGHVLQAVLYDVKSGQIEANVEVRGESLIPLVGDLADQLSGYVFEDAIVTKDALADLSLTELATPSDEALQLFIEGLNAWFFNNDFNTAIEQLNAAVTLDPAFAMANQYLGNLYRVSGRNTEAIEAIRAALKYNYKLDSETRFKLKANAYATEGQTEKAIKVLEMWTEVHPDSFDAFKTLSANYLLFSRLDEAEAAADRAADLNPEATEMYLTKANIQRLKGDFTRAAGLLQEYLAHNPDDADARINLGNTFQQTGQFDQALEAYEQVSFMAGREFEAEMAISNLEARTGDFAAADARLDLLDKPELTDSEHVQIGLLRIRIDLKQGRIRDSLAELESFSQMAQRSLPPLQYVFTVSAMTAAMQGAMGQVEEALALLDELEADLPPQMAGFIDIYRAMMFDSVGDYERMGEVTERLAQAAQQNNLPMLQPMVEGATSRVLSEQGNIQEAVELAEQAFLSARTSFIGNDETVMNAFEIWRATAYRKAGDLDTARSYLTTHLQRAPSNADARLELARVENEAGNTDQALELARQVMRQWAAADADFVELPHAQALMAELQAASGN